MGRILILTVFRAAASRFCARMMRQMRVVEKRQLLSADEIGRTLQRLAHEIVEKSGGTQDLALIGVRRRGVPLSQRLAKTVEISPAWKSRSARLISRFTATISPPSARSRSCTRTKSISRGQSRPGDRGRRALHRPHHSRRHERPLRSRPPQAHSPLRAD